MTDKEKFQNLMNAYFSYPIMNIENIPFKIHDIHVEQYGDTVRVMVNASAVLNMDK